MFKKFINGWIFPWIVYLTIIYIAYLLFFNPKTRLEFDNNNSEAEGTDDSFNFERNDDFKSGRVLRNKQSYEAVAIKNKSDLYRYLTHHDFRGNGQTIYIDATGIKVNGQNRYHNIKFTILGDYSVIIRGESIYNPNGVISIALNTSSGCIVNDGDIYCIK